MQRICCRQFLLHTLVSAKPATRSFFRTNVSLQKGCRTFLSVRPPFPSPLFYKIKSLKSTFSRIFLHFFLAI